MSTRAMITSILGAAALCVAHNAFAEVTFQPGLYETKVSYPDDGPGVETTRECLTAAEAKQESLERRLAETVQDASCKFTQRSIGGGRFSIAGTCNNDGVRSTLKQTGTYSATAMAMNMHMTLVASAGTAPISVRMVMSSRRVAATCPAGSDKD
ncbi:hypothetical protein N800_07030 [Lysobacter daejeonensis GH1-9]|uniref:DUF3617 family protein n=1 Tax=Lysobacter daejeonensis GH1-9 TaxID=1385517 RepID=A0A0A0EU37_9GAMM|nr:DUF3617 domain-containing protein [Lysobacter daejeonensis]KGM53653.1 hypothetical protein N800_07030 [Lysobacter daejeonensis GH1-9]